MRETFLIDSELARDAIYAGIWTRLCTETRRPECADRFNGYVDRFTNTRGDPSTIFDLLDQDVAALTEAREQLRTLEAVPIGSTVELNDVERFMPWAWQDNGPNGPRWIYMERESRDAELLDTEGVVRVRAPHRR